MHQYDPLEPNYVSMHECNLSKKLHGGKKNERERVVLEHYHIFLIQNLEKILGILSLLSLIYRTINYACLSSNHVKANQT